MLTKSEIAKAVEAVRNLADIIERLEKATWPESQSDVLRKIDHAQPKVPPPRRSPNLPTPNGDSNASKPREIMRRSTRHARHTRDSIMTTQTEAKRLARCRTLLMVAEGKVNSLPDHHPQRRDMERKLNVIKDKLSVQERDHEASR